MVKALILAAALLSIAGTGLGSGIDVSVSGNQNREVAGEFVPSSFFSFGAASRFDLQDRLTLFVKGEYGSGDTDPLSSTPAENIYDSRGRLWTVETGVDFTPLSRLLFLRVSGGIGYLLHDHCEIDTYNHYRITESETEGLFTVGAGTRFPLGDIPVINSMHLLLSWKTLGDDQLITGEIGIGL